MATIHEPHKEGGGTIDAPFSPGMQAAAKKPEPEIWQLRVHENYSRMLPMWEYVSDFYTGAVLEPGKIAKYLVQRKAAEGNAEYDERKAIAYLPYHFSRIFDTFTGMLSEVEDSIDRQFQPEDAAEGLGAIEEEGTSAHRIWRDVDGKGTNYIPFWQQVDTDFSLYDELYFLADGIKQDAAGVTIKDPTFRVFFPWSVTNWREDAHGNLVEVLVMHTADSRGSIKDGFKPVKRYTLYEIAGWTEYEIRERNGKPEAFETARGQYEFWSDSNRRRRILPIFRVPMPMKRYVAYQAAKWACNIFNATNERDHKLRCYNIDRFGLVANDEQFKKHVENISKGWKVLQHYPDQQQQHYYISPKMDGAEVANDTLDQKTKEFHIATFMEYANSVKTTTATEERQDFRAGIASYLRVKVSALDEAENGLLKRWEQIEFPNRPELWGQARVERKRKFEDITDRQLVDMILAAVFGGRSVPAGKTAKTAAAKRVLDYLNLKYDEAEIEADAEEAAEKESQAEDALSEFGLQ